jgi:hypothetical protein
VLVVGAGAPIDPDLLQELPDRLGQFVAGDPGDADTHLEPLVAFDLTEGRWTTYHFFKWVSG